MCWFGYIASIQGTYTYVTTIEEKVRDMGRRES